MIDDDIRALREALAEGPTPGPWWLEHDEVDIPNHVPVSTSTHGAFAQVVWCMEDDESSPVCEATANYIAACDPDRIARLLNEIERLRAENAEWREKAATWLASPEAAQRLAGYREIAAQAAEARNEAEALRADRRELESAISNALPGVRYMDPPDGGSPSLAEQLLRMAEDAERYLWLRANSYLWPTEEAVYSDAQVEAVALWHVKAMTNEGIDAAIDAARK